MLAVRSSHPDPNFYHFVMDIAWFGLALATTTRFLSVYAIHLGATASQLAWMTALPALVMLVGSMLSSWWRSRHSDSHRAVFLPAFGFRISFFLLALTPLVPSAWQATWLIAALTLTAIPQGIAGVIFLGLMRESVDLERWTALNSRRHMAMNTTIALGALLAGVWLEKVIFPLNYQIMFFGAFLAALVSLWHVMRVKPLYTIPASRIPVFRRDLWQSQHLRRIVWLVILTHVPFFMVYPLVPLQLVDGLGAAEGFIALFGLVELVGGVFVASVAARWINHLGYRAIMGYAMVGTGVAVGMIALAPALWMTLPAALLLGATWTLAGIGIMSVIADGIAPEQTATTNMVFMQSVGLATFIGPLIGNLLVSVGIHLVIVLLIGSAGRILAGCLIGVGQRQLTHVTES